MAERYTRIYTHPSHQYASGSPVILEAGALLMDNVSGDVIAQLKFRSVSIKPIKLLKIGILQKDSMGRELGEPITFQYLDIDIKRDDEFGAKHAIPLPNKSARSFEIKILETGYSDNSITSEVIAPWFILASPPRIETVLKNSEMIKQYHLKYGNNCSFLASRDHEIWFCSCGALNLDHEEKCHKCGNGFLSLSETEIQKLTFSMEQRLSEEKHQNDLLVAKTIARKKELKTKLRKYCKIAVVALALAVIFYLPLVQIVIPGSKYKAALILQDTNPLAAALEFRLLGNYKDSSELSNKLMEKNSYKSTVCAGSGQTFGIKEDGTLLCVGENEFEPMDVSNWSDIMALDAGWMYTAGVKKDKTVVAVGHDSPWISEISEWKDIMAVSTGQDNIFGLKEDGSVLVVGSNYYGQHKATNWDDIVALSSKVLHTIGLKRNGTVVAAGWNDYGQCEVTKWKDIIAVGAGYDYSVGLKSDGTAVAVGSNPYGQCDVFEWKDIVAISVGFQHTVGLKSDGTVVAVGYNENGQCDIAEWKDIVAITAGPTHTVGLKRDGSVVAVGSNSNGECNVSDWKDIVLF